MIGIRRLIIKTAEVMMIVLVVITIISFAISGAVGGYGAGGESTLLGIIGLIFGALTGLIISAVVASFFFLILEIAENTRRMLRYYEPNSASSNK